jgi:protein-disulfide isomerase
MRPAKTSTIVVGLLGTLALAPILGAQTEPSQPLARIGDQAIYEEDLLPSIGPQLWQLKNQEYELKSKAVQNLVYQRLLDREAQREGLSPEAFFDQMVDRNLPPPSAGEIEAYYLAQKDRFDRPFPEVKPQLEQALTQARRLKAHRDFLNQLMRDTDAVILLRSPRVEVTADPARLRGNPDAPVTIVEFADFQCPYCQAVQQTLKEVMDKYKGKLLLGFRDFPLRQIHPQAQPAAEASRCAGDQGKFWEYHDLLYQNQARLDSNGLKEQARTAGLDPERFEACVASGKFKPAIESDLQSGSKFGVSATPTFYINGVPLSGAQPASAFESIIESELADATSKKAAQ